MRNGYRMQDPLCARVLCVREISRSHLLLHVLGSVANSILQRVKGSSLNPNVVYVIYELWLYESRPRNV